MHATSVCVCGMPFFVSCTCTYACTTASSNGAGAPKQAPLTRTLCITKKRSRLGHGCQAKSEGIIAVIVCLTGPLLLLWLALMRWITPLDVSALNVRVIARFLPVPLPLASVCSMGGSIDAICSVIASRRGVWGGQEQPPRGGGLFTAAWCLYKET